VQGTSRSGQDAREHYFRKIPAEFDVQPCCNCCICSRAPSDELPPKKIKFNVGILMVSHVPGPLG